MGLQLSINVVFVRQERSFLFAWVFEIPTRYQSETKTETILGEKK